MQYFHLKQVSPKASETPQTTQVTRQHNNVQDYNKPRLDLVEKRQKNGEKKYYFTAISSAQLCEAIWS